jgi:predicted CXXCH cytochrome family protein
MSKWRYLLSVILLLTAFAMTATWDSLATSPRGFHPKDLACQTCHLSTEVTTDNASQLIASQERLCGACHASAMQLSHPTGFKPDRVLPERYPVDWKGDITCSTCHDIHRGDKGLLRGAKIGRAFCLDCHTESFFTAMTDQGHSIQRLGHLSTSTNPLSLNLDAYSRQCMGCHNENQGGSSLKLDSSGVVRHGTGSANHPIGMRYDRAVATGLYRKPSRLNPAILLPEGKVSCVSCHVGYSKEHGALVRSNARSGLCLECHDI